MLKRLAFSLGDTDFVLQFDPYWWKAPLKRWVAAGAGNFSASVRVLCFELYIFF